MAGYAYANTYRGRIAYQWTVENSVYVDAAFQGRGVGTALMQGLIDACVARGYRQMVAVIGEPTNTASIKLHERFGFHTVGVFRGLGRKHGRWLDTVQMQRALGDGADSAPSNE
ncbi:Phosphinothricin N-acetyltransferase [compost metagenome]